MKTYSEYRAQARETLEGHWGEGAVLTLMYVLIILLVEVLSGGSEFLGSTLFQSVGSAFGSLLSLLVLAPLGTALSMFFLGFARGNDEMQFRNVVNIMRADYARILSATLVISMMVLLGVFTLGILSVYFAFSYAMVPYLLRDYPELTWREAMQTSREMMNGHKMELFVLQMTFLGWAILAILTLGVGLLLLEPYMETTMAHYYQDLKHETIIDTDGVEDVEVVE